MVECKLQNRALDPNIKYIAERVKVPYIFQVSFENSQHTRLAKIGETKIHLMSASLFLAALP